MRTGLDILIVDDSAIIVERMVALLAAIGGVRRITHAGSLEAAREALLLRPAPGVVILDIQLGDGSTIALYESMKERLELSRVVVFTNYPNESHRRKFLGAGADYFFDKSADLEKLVAVVTSLAAEAVNA